jgi:3-deoxy-manno-octulosonate cytidylyltransferase (CMP-KDO synthetase)
MKKIAIIPARYASTRFPAKLLQLLGNKSVIATTYLATKNSELFDDVIIATDSELIAEEIRQYNGSVVMSKQAHESGTDRIAEAVENMEADVIVNVQGDTPFVQKEPLQKLVNVFTDDSVQVASLMEVVQDKNTLADPNVVKVCVDKKMNSLLFSRSIIPFNRDTEAQVIYYKHIGVYAFRKQALLQFTKWPPSVLEQAEKLEQLRFLENGIPLKMVITEPMGLEINTPEDLQKALISLG